MRGTARLAGALIPIAIAGATSGAFGADQSTLGLPDVSVTAPKLTPSWKKFSPYFGDTRVDENKWPNIPCAGSRIASAGAGNCKRGPQISPAGIGLPQQGGPSIQVSNCQIAHDLVMTDVGSLKVEADVMTFDPDYVSGIGFQHRGCFVEAGYSDLREDFPDMNQMTREGNNWRNFREAGDLSTMEFSIGPSDCWAIEKRGPQWHGGYIWVIHASFCRADGRPAEPADLDRALGSLQVRQYESNGNLRPAPR
jgi:hypothetical protein